MSDSDLSRICPLTILTRARSWRWSGRISLLAIIVVPLAVYVKTLAPSITWSHNGADGGDLIAATATLGIPHPTGYPTYVLLGRLFLLIPWGDRAHRLNLMSAVFAALAVALLYLVVLRTFRLFKSGELGLTERLVAGASSLAFAFSPLFWSQALITEVYTLNAFFVALTIYLVLRWVEEPRIKILSTAAFVCGLGAGNHLTILLVAPALLLILVPGRHDMPSSVEALMAIVFPFVLGLSVYLYVPLRAAYDPPVNWGNPDTLRGFLWLVLGKLYRRYFFALPLRYVPSRLSAWSSLLIQQFGWWGLMLGLIGCWSLWQRARNVALFSCALFLGYSVYAIGYNTADSQVYLIPVFLLFALWLGWGTDFFLTGLGQLISPKSTLLRVLPLCLVLAIPVPSLVDNFSSLDLSSDHTAREYGLEALAAVEPEAILISGTDPRTFTLWYFRYAEGKRPDVAVVDGELLRYEWYRSNVGWLHTDIALPVRAGRSGDQEAESLPSHVFALIEQNHDRYPIYVTDPDSQMRNRYRLSQEGPVYRVVARRKD